MRVVSILAILLPIAACSQDERAPVDSQVEPGSASDDETLVADERSLADATQDGPTAQAQTIPIALRGRWGLVAADCTSTRGDAKGLIEVGPDMVSFYESRARLGEVSERDDTSLRATYAVSGEGMEWSRDMQLALADDGARLVRTEFGDDALAEPLTYTKCQTGGDDA